MDAMRLVGGAGTRGSTLSAAAVSETRVDLDWDDFYRSGVDWDVYRNTTPGFAPAPSNRLARGLLDSGFSDSTAAPGTTYYYKVIAVGRDYSAKPVEVSVTTLGTAIPAVAVKDSAGALPRSTSTSQATLFSHPTRAGSPPRAWMLIDGDNLHDLFPDTPIIN